MTNRKLPVSQRGFTLIELLVVVAIIGLLTSVISVSLVRQRIKTRDTKRITDMKQFKTGLDLYFTHANGYPSAGAWSVGSTLTCDSIEIMRISNDPAAPLYNYTYTPGGSSSAGCGGTVRTSYTLQFYMENQAASYTMDEDGVLRNSGGAVVSFDSLL